MTKRPPPTQHTYHTSRKTTKTQNKESGTHLSPMFLEVPAPRPLRDTTDRSTGPSHPTPPESKVAHGQFGGKLTSKFSVENVGRKCYDMDLYRSKLCVFSEDPPELLGPLGWSLLLRERWSPTICKRLVLGGSDTTQQVNKVTCYSAPSAVLYYMLSLPQKKIAYQ